jgi:formate-dependent nitrite reductase membrane component NrfD
MLGGAGGMLAVPVLCLGQRCHLLVTSVLMTLALLLHFSAFVLGITAIQFYLTKPGKIWGPSIFGNRVHGAWWWIALTIMFSLINLLASILYLIWFRRNKNCGKKEQLLADDDASYSNA